MRTTDIFPLGALALGAAGLLCLFQFFSAKRRHVRVKIPHLFFVRFLGLWYAAAALTLLFKLVTIRFALLGSPDPRWYSIGNLVPFHTIAQYARQRNWVQLGGNAAVLFPLPLLLRFNFPKMKYKRVLWIALCAALLIEPAQFLVNFALRASTNVIDMDDLLLNAAGCLLGLLALKLLQRLRPKRAP
ncbi:MAG: VanZ family protein [Oscillospiraceae bacterium]|jgi:glycopeptide antibiotics resistance protein|nr:VanZ family protein [Oscillospiraceae bacterium]